MSRATVTLINYGLGNIQAFANIYDRLDIPVDIASSPDQLARATKLILPGVGAFDWAMGQLESSGLRPMLDEMVMGKQIPVLGVCVGMQMMAGSSDEGEVPGLGWIDATVRRFASPQAEFPLPHMGWNDVRPTSSNCLFRSLKSPRYYFLHSFFVEAANQEDVLATAEYGRSFTAAIRCGTIFGTQFHPEKSHDWGVCLLKNFAEL